MRRTALGTLLLIVAVAPARAEDVWIAEGVVLPRHTASLHVRVPETVLEVTHDIGDAVKKGEVLIRLDDRQAKAELKLAVLSVKKKELERKLAQAKIESAKASLDGAKAAADRVQRIKGPASQEELARTAADVARLSAEVQAAEVQAELAALDVEIAKLYVAAEEAKLDLLTVRAPFDGLVAARNVQPGDYARGDQALMDVLAGPFIVEAVVPEKFVPYAKVGRPVEVRVTKDRMIQLVPGKIRRVAVVLDTRNRTLRMEIELTDPKINLLPGSVAEVKTQDDEKEPEKKTGKDEKGKE
jgi:multidrug resistance efflux pump